ncbi:MAG: HlyD family efflux transporter periplasmic adaptor subunit [Algoriphagus sp.]|jgi:multidrug resistance efflux pump|nr:HlyD family efflux transporter periplasmic adaptor subunit [Algoriphagus sp.]
MKKSFLPLGMALCMMIASCGGEVESGISQVEGANSVSSQSLSISQVVGLARIEPEGKIANLSSPVSGIVKRVLKLENELVNEGEILIELDHEIEIAKLAKTQSRIITQQAKIKSQEMEVKKLTAQATNKRKEFDRLAKLLESGSETQQKVDDVETELNVLESSLDGAKANLEMMKAELTEIQRETDLNKKEVEQRLVKAPANGRILSMDAVQGNYLNAQNSFAEFVPEGKLIARAEVDELFANQVAVGQTAQIRLVGSESILTEGRVIYTSAALKRKSLFSEKAGDQEDRRVREVKIELAQQETLLINARVECVIQTSK